MIVIVLTACPEGLRGSLTRWLMEISAGVYVGKVTARVRELLWERVEDEMKTGRAIMVYSARNEQGMEFRVHGHEWKPVDFDGLTLMLRPRAQSEREKPPGTPHAEGDGRPPPGWSNAARRRKYGRTSVRSPTPTE